MLSNGEHYGYSCFESVEAKQRYGAVTYTAKGKGNVSIKSVRSKVSSGSIVKAYDGNEYLLVS